MHPPPVEGQGSSGIYIPQSVKITALRDVFLKLSLPWTWLGHAAMRALCCNRMPTNLACIKGGGTPGVRVGVILRSTFFGHFALQITGEVSLWWCKHGLIHTPEAANLLIGSTDTCQFNSALVGMASQPNCAREHSLHKSDPNYSEENRKQPAPITLGGTPAI